MTSGILPRGIAVPVGEDGSGIDQVTCEGILSDVLQDQPKACHNPKRHTYLPCSVGKRGLQFRGDFRRLAMEVRLVARNGFPSEG